MIFLTVGTQLPFDRLVSAVDVWCKESGTGSDVFAQVGRLGSESYRAKHFHFEERLSQEEYTGHVKNSKLVVSHAGMGSIITALTYEKPILIMPRLARLGEHRNEHQLATIERFRSRPGIIAADDEVKLVSMLDSFKRSGWNLAAGRVSKFANQDLLDALRHYILKKPSQKIAY